MIVVLLSIFVTLFFSFTLVVNDHDTRLERIFHVCCVILNAGAVGFWIANHT